MRHEAARRLVWVMVVASVLFLRVGVGAAQEGGQGWQPAPPMPDEFDWIQLKSGEWLKGELIALYNESLEFESDELDKLTLDWGDVTQVRTARIVQVRFLGGAVATGKLYVEGDTVRIIGDQELGFERANLLTIAAGDPSERNFWSGGATLGGNVRRGNTEQVEVNASVAALRRTVRSRIGLDYFGNYNVTSDVTAANNHRVRARVDWFVSDRLFVRPLVLEYYRDPLQNIARRWTIGAAVGYQLVDTSRVDWEVTIGPAYQYTKFESVTEGESDTESAGAFAMGTSYSNELTSKLDFLFDYGFLLTKKAAGRYTHHLQTGFEFDAVRLLDFNVSIVWDRIQEPRAETSGVVPKQDDLRLIFGVGFDF